MSQQPVVAVIVGAGLGVRFGGHVPKAALKLTGKAVIAMSIEAMAAGGCTHAVTVISPAVAAALGPARAASPIPVIQTFGGKTRQESCFNGLKAVRDDPVLNQAEVVLIHDAVRPMVPADVVSRVIRAVKEGADAVTPAIPVADSMRMIGDADNTQVVDRSRLRAIQTPQGFPLDVILAAHERMAELGEDFTDDVTCAERAGYHVELVEGSRMSMKITEPTDMTIAKALWTARASLGHHSGRRFWRHLPWVRR